MDNGIELFEKEKIGKALIQLAAPAVLVSLINIIYEMIHSIFIAQLNNTAMLASTSCTMTLVLVITKLGEAVGIGGSTYLGREYGAGNREGADKIVSTCMAMDLVIGMALTVICLIIMKPYIYWQTDDLDVIRYAIPYGYVYIGSAMFQVFQLSLVSLFRSAGDVKFPLRLMIVTVVITIGLDPIFMFVLNMGTTGAALSTAIANFVACVICFYHLLAHKTILNWRLFDFSVDKKAAVEIFAVGSSVYIRNFMSSFSMAIFNKQAFVYGKEFSAGCNVGKYAMYFVNFFIQGVANGLLPLASYTYGAENYPRLYEAIMWCLKVLTGYSVLAILFMTFCSDWFISFFTKDPEAIAYGARYLRAYNYSLLLYSVYYILTTLLQSAGMAKESMIISLSRQGLIYVPLLLVLPMLFGEDGIFFSQPMADWLTVIASLFMSRKLLKKIYINRKAIV